MKLLLAADGICVRLPCGGWGFAPSFPAVALRQTSLWWLGFAPSFPAAALHQTGFTADFPAAASGFRKNEIDNDQNSISMNRFILLAASALAFSACGKASDQTGQLAADGQTAEKTEQQTKTSSIMKPIELTKSEFLARVANYEASPNEWKYLGDKPAVVDFYATWCGPCKRLAPMLEEIAAEYGDRIYVYKIDVDKEQELAGVFGIQSIPTLLFVPMNGAPQISQGLMPKNDLKAAIDQILSAKQADL